MAPVLALVQSVPGVIAAHVDRSGTHLRLRLRGRGRERALQTLRALLRGGGYQAEVLSEAERMRITGRVGRWYDRDGALELSREEAGALARQIIGAFAAREGLAEDVRAALTDLLRESFERVFLESGEPLRSLGTRLAACGERLSERTAMLLSAGQREALTAAITDYFREPE